jgi:hypothetical protein
MSIFILIFLLLIHKNLFNNWIQLLRIVLRCLFFWDISVIFIFIYLNFTLRWKFNFMFLTSTLLLICCAFILAYLNPNEAACHHWMIKSKFTKRIEICLLLRECLLLLLLLILNQLLIYSFFKAFLNLQVITFERLLKIALENCIDLLLVLNTHILYLILNHWWRLNALIKLNIAIVLVFLILIWLLLSEIVSLQNIYIFLHVFSWYI